MESRLIKLARKARRKEKIQQRRSLANKSRDKEASEVNPIIRGEVWN